MPSMFPELDPYVAQREAEAARRAEGDRYKDSLRERQKQKVLLTGLGLCEGQEQLFQTDGRET